MAKREENKNQKLIEKINTLIEKLEGEKNPFKRALHTINLELLNARMQKQINIIDIKEKYDTERQQRKEDAENRMRRNTNEKYNMIKDRNYYKQILDEINDCDPQSPNFAFGDELKKAGGDINNLIDEMRKNGNTELAFQIESATKYRENYDKTKKELENMKSEGSKIQKETNQANKKSAIKEKALVTKEKVNIFKRIFNSIKSGFKEFKTSREENKELKNEMKSIESDLEGKRTIELEWIDEEYKQVLAEIEERKAKINQYYDNKKESEVNNRESFTQSLRNEKAAQRSNAIAQELMDKQPVQENVEQQNNEQEPEND